MNRTGFYVAFRGELGFCSNFYPARIRLEDLTYATAEHVFQAMKTTSSTERIWVRDAPTPGAAKRRGRRVTLRAHWDTLRRGTMARVVREKFMQNPDLIPLLLATGKRRLAEVNTWGDVFWGECPEGVGQNVLGQILMDLRDDLRKNQ